MKKSEQFGMQKGFTLIELLVVIAVISVLVSLLLPAVQRAREAARLSSCKNNLKQLSIAVHSFHEVRGKLPPSDLADHWATWAVFLLPYVEQGAAYDMWDIERQYYAQPAEAAVMSEILLCPSRSGVHDRGSEGDATIFFGGPSGFSIMIGPAGWSDYACVSGTTESNLDGAFIRSLTHENLAPVSTNPNESDINATYTNWILQRSFKDVIDGLSNTIFLGEKHFRPNPTDTSVLNGDTQPGYLRYCGETNFIVQNLSYSGTDWVRRFGSPHQGVCNFSFGDGHVKSISVNIDKKIQSYLSNINDGQVVADF